jgi:putative LPS biosynthesis related aldo/keto reductase
MIDKLILGTVQFGLAYGINNFTGQVSFLEVKAILELAKEKGIKILDTSSAYGDSEKILGDILNIERENFKIISKYPRSSCNVETIFDLTLSCLHRKKIYGYLIHHFDFYKTHPEVWEDMQNLKVRNKVEKIGFSLYKKEELQYLLDNSIQFDILQVPYNLFDRQFEPYLKDLKKQNVEIHVRSVFLQGLFFHDLSSIDEKLKSLKPYLEQLHEYCIVHSLSIEQLALNYVVHNPSIDGVLIGVDNCCQLQSNIDVLNNGISQEDIDFVNSIHVEEYELLNPINWK